MAEMISHSFTDFPEDVQFCILSFLSPIEIANFACTSHQFSPLCQNDSKLWYAICDRRWGSKTQINKWGNGKISYKLLYRVLTKWENLIGFWRRCGQNQQNLATGIKSASLIYFEWGSSFVSGYRVSPSQNGSYGVAKIPFLWMTISPDGQIVNYLDPDGNTTREAGELGFLEMDLLPVNVNFIGDFHFSVEENLGFAYSTRSKGAPDDADSGYDSGSPGSLPGTSEMYQYYANRTSTGLDRAWRKHRRRDKEKQARRKWETEHFLKIVDSSPTPSRPLQGLWKGICDDMRLEFYLVAYDGAGISCRRVGDLTEWVSSSTPVFWTSNPEFIDSPLSPEEDRIYNARVHLQPAVVPKGEKSVLPLMDSEAVSRVMYINSSYDLVIPGMVSANPWQVEGRIWEYKDGTFGFGFLRDNYIIDLKYVARNGCLLDPVDPCSD